MRSTDRAAPSGKIPSPADTQTVIPSTVFSALKAGYRIPPVPVFCGRSAAGVSSGCVSAVSGAAEASGPSSRLLSDTASSDCADAASGAAAGAAPSSRPASDTVSPGCASAVSGAAASGSASRTVSAGTAAEFSSSARTGRHAADSVPSTITHAIRMLIIFLVVFFIFSVLPQFPEGSVYPAGHCCSVRQDALIERYISSEIKGCKYV